VVGGWVPGKVLAKLIREEAGLKVEGWRRRK